MSDDRREALEKKVARAKHMGKPDAENASTFRDVTGRWIFELYTGSIRRPEVCNGRD